ncbi:hypothetical protein [Phytoactinopolyspora halotolerans]|uniref:Uncharacterized protein n=1 Tax=Phytoactinopolyspora halotolerans TaxID=1981512 RepID=A0A6L9S716_9ACTN|nr:hypothetical protein [Phytoactinopolyspora halotolerans]NEE00362.1 hypothetical protein [Phytoactinopolyspora halotolerans]
MFKKTLRSALIAAAALVTATGFASTAVAAPQAPAASSEATVSDATDLESVLDVPDVNIGNDLCLLPWFWPGPFNVLTKDQMGSYSACNGSGSSESSEGINILNDACIAPWLWQGPFNVLTDGQEAYYEACNDYTAADSFANAIAQYMTIEYMIDSEMLDESMFEQFLAGEVTSHEVIQDEGVTEEFEGLLPEEEITDEGGLMNNACVLPWLWQGPFNFLTNGQYADYQACNG